MKAKTILNNHLKKHIPLDKYKSPKELEQLRYNAAIDAINQALNINKENKSLNGIEIKQQLIAEYSQKGHPQYPEDTWDTEKPINNEDDLYQFMVELHRRDAYSFNNFPLTGRCYTNNFTFTTETYIIHNGVKYINKDRLNVNPPDYFESAKNRYNALVSRMKRTLPKLRIAHERRIQEKMERAKLYELQQKYLNE